HSLRRTLWTHLAGRPTPEASRIEGIAQLARDRLYAYRPVRDSFVHQRAYDYASVRLQDVSALRRGCSSGGVRRRRETEQLHRRWPAFPIPAMPHPACCLEG